MRVIDTDGGSSSEPDETNQGWIISDAGSASMDSKALFETGEALYYGRGAPENHAAAAQWYRRAAEAGMSKAQAMLGLLYFHGDGVPQDDVQAAEWVRRAAKQRDRDGQLALGFMHESGRGVPQDDEQAAFWYRKAAENGEPIAQHAIGIFCFHGRGVRQSYLEAFFWFDLAALWKYDDDFGDTVSRDRAIAVSRLPIALQESLNAANKSTLGDGWGI